jgi:hypothetical protein
MARLRARACRSPVPACLAAGLLLASFDARAAEDATVCERAAAAAEAAHGVPAGLLRAIGIVEAGRRDFPLGHIAPWPWTTDIAGAGRWWDTRAEAIAAVRAAGVASVDVGCFQVNLPSHPDAFATLDEAFDPASNADYAARFLVLLRDRLGGWSEAAGAYHSRDAALSAAYRQAVLSAWTDRPAGWDQAAFPSTVRAPLPASGVRVWGPSGLLSAEPAEAHVIRISFRSQRGFPRIRS